MDDRILRRAMGLERMLVGLMKKLIYTLRYNLFVPRFATQFDSIGNDIYLISLPIQHVDSFHLFGTKTQGFSVMH